MRNFQDDEVDDETRYLRDGRVATNWPGSKWYPPPYREDKTNERVNKLTENTYDEKMQNTKNQADFEEDLF